MALDLGDMNSIFPRSERTDEGIGTNKMRIGQATIIVARDGSGNTDDIQEAISLLPSRGGTIYIKEGQYTLTSSISFTANNISFVGAGKSTKIVVPASTTGFFVNGATGTTIKDLWLYGAGDTGTFSIGIRIMAGSVNCTVEGCWIENFKDEGIQFAATGSDHCIIRGNFIFGNYSSGIEMVQSSDVIIVNNYSYDNDLNGISLTSCNNSIISNNIITGNTGDGIMLGNDCDRNVITNNQCRSNGDDGIDIIDNTSSNNLLIGNVCLTNSSNQIEDAGTNTLPNGAKGTNNLALDDLNIIA